jgi:uncharacterized membrane protein YhaH (DUF805 family)
MAFCSKCGEKLDDGTKFCSKCGAKVEGSAVNAPVQPVYQQAQGQQFNTPPPYQQAAAQAAEKNPWQYFCGVLKKYAVFQGRARRAEFWWFFLFNWIIGMILMVIDWKAGFMLTERQGLLSSLYSLAVFLPNLGVLVRRMHDCNKAGPYWLIPIYGWFVLPCTAGDIGPNRFGPDPKQTND